MNFYGINYLESQSNLNDYIKYFFIFGVLIVLIIAFSLYLRHRIQTLANRIIAVSANGVVDRADTTYDEFLENKDVQKQLDQLFSKEV